MRILFDKNVPKVLRHTLIGHHVQGTIMLGWGQLKNGDLLKTAENAGFDLMVTCDQNIAYQQNLSQRKIALVVLGAGNWPIVRNHIPEIIAAIDVATPGSYTFIEIPLPPKSEYKS